MKKKMRKLLRNKKALSPVVAAIILIAVTVAVSIAVAAWMGALTLTFMTTEQLAFTDFRWDTATLSYCNMTVKNTGTAVLTIYSVKVNNVLNSTAPGWKPYESNNEANHDWTLITLDPNEQVVIRVDPTKYFSVSSFTRGGNYAFTVVTTKNNPFGPYTVSAPS
jgi:flagellin-like protein